MLREIVKAWLHRLYDIDLPIGLGMCLYKQLLVCTWEGIAAFEPGGWRTSVHLLRSRVWRNLWRKIQAMQGHQMYM